MLEIGRCSSCYITVTKKLLTLKQLEALSLKRIKGVAARIAEYIKEVFVKKTKRKPRRGVSR